MNTAIGDFSAPYLVTDADTATALGSGDVHVLATPRLIAWLEAETVRVAAPHLAAGQTSVGTGVRIRHRRPTPVGGQVGVVATLTDLPAGARLSFEVTATDGTGAVIADGTIDRVIVDRAAFSAAAGLAGR